MQNLKESVAVAKKTKEKRYKENPTHQLKISREVRAKVQAVPSKSVK
jgi:hypothetical protein